MQVNKENEQRNEQISAHQLQQTKCYNYLISLLKKGLCTAFWLKSNKLLNEKTTTVQIYGDIFTNE